MLYQLKYQNDLGQTIAFGGNNYAFVDTNMPHTSASNYRLNKFDGFGDVAADIQRQKSPYQDGSTHVDTVLEERPLFIEFTMQANNFNELSTMRRNISRVFNPKNNGKLELSYGGNTYVIDCVPEHVPTFSDGGTDSVGNTQVGVIDLIAPNPYWRSASDSVEQLVTFSGGLTFPLRLPTIFGNQDSEAKSRIIVNDGDAATPIEVTFEGPATSPIRIENETTGDFIEIAQDLLEGEKLWICTEFGRKRVEKILVDGTRQNAFHYIYIDPTGINPSSTFFELQPGNNLLTYDTGEEYEKAPVSVKFKNRYVGI